MGPLPSEPVAKITRRILDGMLAGCDELTDDQKKLIREFGEERQRQFDAELQHGLRRTIAVSGWQCPNCGKAHAPDVSTCPEPARGGSLRERLKAARS